ncbi:MAG TPA: HlyD family secretion protein, partial [Anaeromyxobacteraceae bacterium]|nr:HlyD family secretion protein [Anaeromyxobacteraceae bacterium]
TDVSVDPSTGSVALRAIFPNPRSALLPGMYVRARLIEGVNTQALLVPQVGVTRDARGEATAMVARNGKVELRRLVTGRAIGDAWLVTEGIQPGEQVIVDGLQRIRPGADVSAVPAAPSGATPAAAAGGHG